MPPSRTHQADREQATAQTTNRPAATVKHGNLKCMLWRNESDTGRWYSASLVRVFKDESGFHETTSVPAEDLLRVAFLSQQAYGQLLELKAQDKAAAKDGPDDDLSPR